MNSKQKNRIQTFPNYPPLLPLPTLHLWTKLTLPLKECTPPWVNTQQYVQVTFNRNSNVNLQTTKLCYNQNRKLPILWLHMVDAKPEVSL